VAGRRRMGPTRGCAVGSTRRCAMGSARRRSVRPAGRRAVRSTGRRAVRRTRCRSVRSARRRGVRPACRCAARPTCGRARVAGARSTGVTGCSRATRCGAMTRRRRVTRRRASRRSAGMRCRSRLRRRRAGRFVLSTRERRNHHHERNPHTLSEGTSIHHEIHRKTPGFKNVRLTAKAQSCKHGTAEIVPLISGTPGRRPSAGLVLHIESHQTGILWRSNVIKNPPAGAIVF